MENVKNLSVLNTVAEVELVYKSKVKPSQRPTIKSSKDCYDFCCSKYIADKLNVSPKYLSSLLKKVLTGQSTQQHIHDKLIEKAKEKLSTTNLSVSEIAYELGFGHLQSFSKLFKTKTTLSPLKFRESFN